MFNQEYLLSQLNNKCDHIYIDILDLPQNSNKLVKCICDYCGIYINKPFNKIDINNKIKICCKNCKGKKSKETCMEKYGVISKSQLPETINKMKQTNIKKYGHNCSLHNEIIKQKVIATNIEKYGVDYVVKNKDIRNKMSVTWANTINMNNNGPSSKQQRYICNLTNGELNYPVNRCLLDIAFPDEMIYIEYDGGGHNLSVKFGQITQDQFDKKEIKRKKYLENQGWKLIRIVSNCDLLPGDLQFMELINECKYYLLNNKNSWIKLDIDKAIITCSQYIKEIKFKDLNYVK